jgi:glutamyl-Q tRNA(Asp) synthetase
MTRARARFIEAAFEDLAWLGLDWERPALLQSDRFEAYRDALRALQRLGLLYPAFLTRAEIQAAVRDAETAGRPWPRDPDGAPVYPGSERDWPASRRAAEIATGRSYALRLDIRRALEAFAELSWVELHPIREREPVVERAQPALWGDVILARKEVPASYHLSSVIDDAFQNITHVVRGLDLKPATSVHRLLQSLLGFETPLYFHHRLIVDPAGRKLSKSAGSETLRARREAGETAASLIEGLQLDLA